MKKSTYLVISDIQLLPLSIATIPRTYYFDAESVYVNEALYGLVAFNSYFNEYEWENRTNSICDTWDREKKKLDTQMKREKPAFVLWPEKSVQEVRWDKFRVDVEKRWAAMWLSKANQVKHHNRNDRRLENGTWITIENWWNSTYALCESNRGLGAKKNAINASLLLIYSNIPFKTNQIKCIFQPFCAVHFSLLDAHITTMKLAFLIPYSHHSFHSLS